MKKESGFTLIELMVVMAIIAILATAGLSAYTGYIKKARDATRIADIRAINTIIQGSLSVNGTPPTSMDTIITAANNGQMLSDPLGTASVCYTDTAGTTTGPCGYTYSLCDGGSGYLISANFESKSNLGSYSTTGGAPEGYHVGNCTVIQGGASSCNISSTIGDSCGTGKIYAGDGLITTTADASNGTWQNAIDYCLTLNTGGESGWHSPSISELSVLYTNRVEITGFDVSGAYYWTNQVDWDVYRWMVRFNTGGLAATAWYATNKIRCVRPV